MKSFFSSLTLYDIVLISALFITSLILFINGLNRSSGRCAKVVLDNVELGSLDLETDEIYSFVAGYGEIKVSVEDGKVKIIESGCPHKLCIRTGAAYRSGDVIVCLPQQFMIIVENGESAAVDGVTG